MRRWLVILLVLLTPLRALAADAMALAMAGAQGVPALHAAADAPPAVHGAGPGDCAEHLAAAQHHGASLPDTMPHGEAADAHDEHCATCASCMVCASAALAMQSPRAATPSLPHAVPLNGSARFRSASALPGFKPPIA